MAKSEQSALATGVFLMYFLAYSFQMPISDRRGLGKPTILHAWLAAVNLIVWARRPNTHYPCETRGMANHIHYLNIAKTITLTAMQFKTHIIDIIKIRVSKFREEIPNGC